MRIRRWYFKVGAVGITAGLVACGGGGGQAESPGRTVDISIANRDVVAQAAVAVGLGMGPASTTTNPSAAGPSISAWLQPLTKRVMIARAQREYPQAIYGPTVYPCMVSGSWSETIDDRDNDGGPSRGDVLTAHFNNCQDALDETVNGSITSTLTLVNTTPVPSGSSKMDFSQLSVVGTTFSMTLNGSLLFSYTQPSTSVDVMRFTVNGPMSVAVSNLEYSDNATLLDGFFAEDTYDASLGRTASSVNGQLRFASLGGIIEVSTAAGAPITTYDTDVYPSSGEMRIRGATGTLRITVLSTDAVRLDLDADDNGSFESSSTVTWDWLL